MCSYIWLLIPFKELHEKYENAYGKDGAMGLPELVFVAKEFHGNAMLCRQAEESGQVHRWTGRDGHPWLGCNTSEVAKIHGTMLCVSHKVKLNLNLSTHHPAHIHCTCTHCTLDVTQCVCIFNVYAFTVSCTFIAPAHPALQHMPLGACSYLV